MSKKKSKSKVTLRQYDTNTAKSKSTTKAKSSGKSYSTYKSNSGLYQQAQLAEKNAPKFSSEYSGMKASALNDLNQEFRADLGNNDVYKDYLKDYRLLGTIAATQNADMTDSLSGGYGTTYGDVVANQALANYLGGEREILPQLLQQEKINYQQDVANATNLASLYNQLESQEFAQFQSELDAWNANREYYYNKWYNDYMAHQTSKESNKNNEKTTTVETGTSKTKAIQPVQVTTRGGSGRRGGGRRGYSRRTSTPRITKSAYKNYDNALTWLSNNGYDTDNLLNMSDFEHYMKDARLANGKYTGDRKDLVADYQDYLLNYLQMANGQEDTNYFKKEKNRQAKARRKYYGY